MSDQLILLVHSFSLSCDMIKIDSNNNEIDVIFKQSCYLILLECYVTDEIITSAAGTRVRVGNTDAEGRMAMADSLHYMKLKVINT